MSNSFHTRVLIAEDEEFTLNLLSEVLTAADFEVSAVQNVAEAIATIESFDPHAVITDLNFGVSGPSGADLLAYIDANHPWIGKIVLTSHSSPTLAVPGGITLPDDVTYMVKSELKSISNLITAVKDSITKSSTVKLAPPEDGERIIISQAQGEILLLISEGLTNAAIAKKRGTSLRATETLIQRTFAILGLKNDEDFNPRVLAVRMWQQGKVVIR
jgi:DNA-binding NarL/FixJ family response regulator